MLPDNPDIRVIVPQAMVTLLAMAVLMADVMAPRMSQRRLADLSVIGLLITMPVTALVRPEVAAPAFSGMVIADGYAQFFNLLFLGAALMGVLLSVDFLEREEVSHGEYYALILLSTVGMMIMAAATDLIAVFLGLEVLSIALYILCGYAREKLTSEESALEYFLLGSFASALFLYGVALLYGATGATNLQAIAGKIGGGLDAGSQALLLAGTGLLIVGFGFKVAIVPFHVWTPDVYEGAPTTVTAFMSVGAKAAGFAAFLRVFMDSLGAVRPQAAAIMAALGAVTMIVGNVVAIAQTNIKRMLAYSSIAHAGYMMVGLTAAILDAPNGVPALLFYSFAYAVTNLGAFAVVIAFQRRGEEVLQIDDYAGLGFKYPLLGALMTLFMLSLAGIPPTVGFLGKLTLFTAALETGHLLWLVVLGVMTSVVSVYYYLRVIVVMYMAPADLRTEETPRPPPPIFTSPSGSRAWQLSSFGLLPSGVLQGAVAAFESFRQQIAMR